MKRLACVLALAATPAAAQELPPPETLAGAWLAVCVRDDPGADLPDLGDFRETGRTGDVVTLVHPDGPEMALTAREGFFACEMTLRDAPDGYYDALLAVISPQMKDRLSEMQEEAVETGMVWEAIAETGLTVEAQIARTPDGTVTLTAATGTEAGDPAPEDNASASDAPAPKSE